MFEFFLWKISSVFLAFYETSLTISSSFQKSCVKEFIHFGIKYLLLVFKLKYKLLPKYLKVNENM